MQTAGVICEYNPFHLGHARQLGLIRQQLGPEAAIVCLMSGNYVQRGEPAVFDKCVRARAAVEAGANLVLELPVTYALRSAEGFAAGGVSILSVLAAAFSASAANPEAGTRFSAQRKPPARQNSSRRCTQTYRPASATPPHGSGRWRRLGRMGSC